MKNFNIVCIIYLIILILSYADTIATQTLINNESNQRVQIDYKVACQKKSPIDHSKIVEPHTKDFLMPGDQCFIHSVEGAISLGDQKITTWGKLETPSPSHITITNFGEHPLKYHPENPNKKVNRY
jgi:hypothetical protein